MLSDPVGRERWPGGFLPYRVNSDLELRLLVSAHAQELYTLVDRNREHLSPWFQWIGRYESIDDARAFARLNLQRLADNEGFAAGIWHHGELVGLVDLFNINWESRVAEIGYWLDKEHQGRGLATMASRALAEHALGGLGLEYLEARVAPGNARSASVAARLSAMTDGRVRLVRSDQTRARPLLSELPPSPTASGATLADSAPPAR